MSIELVQWTMLCMRGSCMRIREMQLQGRGATADGDLVHCHQESAPKTAELRPATPEAETEAMDETRWRRARGIVLDRRAALSFIVSHLPRFGRRPCGGLQRRAFSHSLSTTPDTCTRRSPIAPRPDCFHPRGCHRRLSQLHPNTPPPSMSDR